MFGHPMEIESIVFLVALKCASWDWGFYDFNKNQ